MRTDLNAFERARIAEIAVARELRSREFARLNAEKQDLEGRLQVDFDRDLSVDEFASLVHLSSVMSYPSPVSISTTFHGYTVCYFEGRHTTLESLRRIFDLQSLTTDEYGLACARSDSELFMHIAKVEEFIPNLLNAVQGVHLRVIL